MALKAVRTCLVDKNGRREIDIKRYAKVEKVPGGSLEESCVLDGIMLNKDVVHPRMKRRLENPRILLLDCNLEFKKGESQTNIELSGETDFNRILQLEEEFIKKMCDNIIAAKPDLVITEKGVSGKNNMLYSYKQLSVSHCLSSYKKFKKHFISCLSNFSQISHSITW